MLDVSTHMTVRSFKEELKLGIKLVFLPLFAGEWPGWEPLAGLGDCMKGPKSTSKDQSHQSRCGWATCVTETGVRSDRSQRGLGQINSDSQNTELTSHSSSWCLKLASPKVR